ncbi:hypothetical protein CAPTEDRAFT_122410 [Capitella teleta]|uniref:Sperm microtubule inner protein 1 C-terminal domain-containing protein n=1 Tax=Capitella teleta TaxID=283909 RepID=R7TA64_CAPTE|nr:hypothetical protein CAPTEDRAFT_122410 [Capitella teleta]|eukprot:ELT88275.1 hypothetical protein CAPTEDRAFT_122410 [Capitella teleta]
MSRDVSVDTQYQEFLKETYNKERDTRLDWHMKKMADKKTTEKDSKQMDVFRKKIEAACPKPQSLPHLKNAKPKNYHRHKTMNDFSSLAAFREKRGRVSIVPDMLPAPERSKTLLYDGFTKEEKGRYQYLNHRRLTIPENKYRFPILSNMDYGWGLNDVIKPADISKPDAGRTRIIATTFYRPNGIPGLRCSATY